MCSVTILIEGQVFSFQIEYDYNKLYPELGKNLMSGWGAATDDLLVLLREAGALKTDIVDNSGNEISANKLILLVYSTVRLSF